ncbi:glutathione S-transferase [Erythrobacter longus]|uniref:Glutathione S-transferase n=1 Tax=Erythrobacter longus TaxID=1044 RepID=A0A074MAM1_ERYLO|nr:glutathione S-transferase [Erythrobacter longus]KEO91861.1 glutathione S-transferase [Erythrobacter longus]
MSAAPILYSFRRCPYAMRGRMGLWIAGITVELREVKLANKPPELGEASPKATVPVLVLQNGEVIDESIAIARWALSQNDPEGWLEGDDTDLIAEADGPFKHHLDRYKYPNRYEHEEGFGTVDHQAEGLTILKKWDARIAEQGQMCGPNRTLADIALFPFIRQFANHNRAWFDAQDLPHLHPWLKAHLASDLFKSIMPKFTPWRNGDAPIAFGPYVEAGGG